jgi:hypothetical protein
MSTILYLDQAGTGDMWLNLRGKYWLSGRCYTDGHYFRVGHDELFPSSPTFFTAKEDAIAAAEAMGFTVLQ